MNPDSMAAPRERVGLLLGGLAVLFWSTTASLIVLGCSRMPVWPYVSLSALIACATQLTIHRTRKGPWRICFLLPRRLWVGGILPFVAYGLMYPLALVLAALPAERLAVNLLNYLWPVLTVVFSLLWVPGIRVSARLILAIVLAVPGLILANVSSVSAVLRGEGSGAWPFVLGGTIAVLWAVYSSLLARWRSWAHAYSTAPMGFALVSLFAGIIALVQGQWAWPIGSQWFVVVLNGLFPWGLGYLLWEKALHRAHAGMLGVFAATIPVTSTLLLCLVQRHRPSATTLTAAAVMVAAVLLTIRRRDGSSSPAAGERID
ncbi:MAG: EamA family transporter [Phycisphaerae bacterium]|nr:EamA family transporter [Phycisphaerae bacterium]